MKKLLSALLCFAMTTGVMAEGIKVANVTLPQNTSAGIQIELDNPSVAYESFTMQIELPEGVVPVMAENGYPSFAVSSRLSNQLSAGYKEGNIATFARLTDGNAITGTSGLLFTAFVKVEGNVAVGTELTAKVSAVTFTTTSLTTDNLDDVTFTITIGEPADTRTVLDETSTTVPEDATGVDVRVKRTIKANEWSTICLPFAMTEAQVKSAFGNDVQLGDFLDYEYDDGAGTITVNFTDATEIEANHPYIIKVSSAITEFTADEVAIAAEDNPRVEYDNGLTGKKRKVFGTFAGTFVADFDFYNGASYYPLFLSGNKFYYATENTMHMKAFRAYFDFEDYLPEAESASSRITMNFIDDEPTGISNISHPTNSRYYDLQGRQIEKPGKGVYVRDGRKVVIK